MAMVICGVEHQPKGYIRHIDFPIGCRCSSFVAFHRQVPHYVVAKRGDDSNRAAGYY